MTTEEENVLLILKDVNEICEREGCLREYYFVVLVLQVY